MPDSLHQLVDGDGGVTMAYTTLTAMWTGTGGGTGYTRMHWRGNLTTAEITQQLNAMRTFLVSLTTYVPTGVFISFSGLGQEYDDAGVLKSELSVTPPSNIAGTGSGSWSAASGAVINWNTGVFNENGHRIRGRSYLVPLVAGAYSAAGGVSGTLITNVTTAGNTLVTGLIPKVVISKTPTGHYKDATNVTACQIGNKAAVLTSRRD